MTKFLDPLDSAFILLENPGTSMNIGAVVELGAGEPHDPEERFARIKSNIASRIHEIPVLAQRVVRAPFDMTWPILIKDRSFDLDRHVVRVALPTPGSQEQLNEFVSDFLSRPLSPQRPLWQMLVIEGRANGNAVLVMKAHHALADGVSFAETFANFFDISPDVRSPTERVDDGEEEPTVTTSLGLLVEGFGRLRQRPQLIIENLASWGSRFYEIARALAAVVVLRGRRHATPDQPSIFEARKTSLNGSAGIEKTFLRARVPLADAKRAAKAHGATVTDFVMASTSGALRRLLDDRGEELKKDLIAFVPINVRGEGDTAELGNQISGMLVALHVDTIDLLERLRAISADALKTVGEQRTHRAKIFQDVPRVLGPTLLSLGGKVVSAFSLFDRIPMANLMISSVPGPPIPLWLSGYPVEAAAPYGPLVGAISLNITVLGFGEYLEFGLLGCADRMDDLAALRDYIVDEANMLIALTPS
ncbi:MAG TPA: wax ester/triacylglycerol synthase family O-acyltransferase [Acidimicrobiales bacterium]|nr:wax ester/triacylglycerol synthase family O-acyltransferase [Acidimicrobiales bacterium]